MKNIGTLPGAQPAQVSRVRAALGVVSRFSRTYPIGAIAAGFLVFLGFVAIFADLLAPSSPSTFSATASATT